MIQNDLFHMSDSPPVYQGAVARRNITVKIEEEFEKTHFDIAAYWDSVSPIDVEREPTQLIEEPVESSEGQVIRLVEETEGAQSQDQEQEEQVQEEEQKDKKESA